MLGEIMVQFAVEKAFEEAVRLMGVGVAGMKGLVLESSDLGSWG